MKTKQKGFQVIELIIILCIACFIGLIVMVALEPDETDPAAYQTICLENHEYWHANLDFGQVLAPKLTDEGLPVTCK